MCAIKLHFKFIFWALRIDYTISYFYFLTFQSIDSTALTRYRYNRVNLMNTQNFCFNGQNAL